MDGKEHDVFWYPSQATSPPPNYTPGRRTIDLLITLVTFLLQKSYHS
jgi:hypothetical protein